MADNKKTVEFKEQEFLKKESKPQKNGMLFYVLTIMTALLIVFLIIGGALFFAIKNNVNGIADSMGDTFRNIPVLKLALPEKPEPEDEKSMTEEQVRAKYTGLLEEKKQLEQKLTEMQEQLTSLQDQVGAKAVDSDLLQQQKSTLEGEMQVLTAEKEGLATDLKNISDALAKGDTAAFKQYFEKIDPVEAARLYSEILGVEKISDDVKKYCAIYEEMDAAVVAAMMEQMNTGKMKLIIEILRNLKKTTTADILSAMTPEFAAKVSEQLAKEYNVGVSAAATAGTGN